MNFEWCEYYHGAPTWQKPPEIIGKVTIGGHKHNISIVDNSAPSRKATTKLYERNVPYCYKIVGLRDLVDEETLNRYGFVTETVINNPSKYGCFIEENTGYETSPYAFSEEPTLSADDLKVLVEKTLVDSYSAEYIRILDEYKNIQTKWVEKLNKAREITTEAVEYHDIHYAPSAKKED